MTGVSERVRYKAGKSKSYWPAMPLQDRKRRLVEEWRRIVDRLAMAIAGINIEFPEFPEQTSFRVLKKIEDTVDALVCSWMGVQYLDGAAVPAGDADSAIWIPHSALQVARPPRPA